jgi:hypothetical protein
LQHIREKKKKKEKGKTQADLRITQEGTGRSGRSKR